MSYCKRLETCAAIAREREEQYGTIEENFADTSVIASAAFGIEISPADIARVLAAAKLSRQKFKPKQDNVDDAVNYLLIADELDNLRP